MIRNTAVTVCGPLNVNKLGVTYVHEHLMVKPQLPDEYYIPVSYTHLGAVWQTVY